MMIYKIRKYFLFVILVLGLFLPVFDARAEGGIFGIGNFAFGAVSNLFAYSLSWFFTILGKLLAVMVSMLDWVVRIRIYTDLPIIQSGWGIMRDFANMLFIIALIVMAYGTIFNIPKYDFRSLLPRFIVIAVLINFSLVLGGLMIDATQVLNNTFLNAMGDISGRLGDGLKPAALLPNTANIEDASSIVDVAGASIVTLFFGIWFLFAFIVSVAVPLAVAFVRIPVLWALLIVSPLAWLLSILPATKGAYDKWWHQFLAWNLFLPYYLFFLYFALFFLSQQDVVLAGMLRGAAGQAIVNQDFSKFGIQNSVTFGLLFYYILVGIFLIGGTKVAMSAGTFSGTGIVNVAKWGRDRVANRIGWTAAQRAGKGLLEQAREREEARVSRQAAYITGKIGAATGGRFGERGVYEKTIEEQLSKRMSKEKERQRPFANNVTELERLSTSGSTEQRLAARMRLTELGAQTPEQIQETYRMLGGDRSEAANKYVTGLDPSKYTKAQRREMLNTVTNTEARQKIAETMIEKGEFTQEEIQQTAQRLFQTKQEMRGFLEKGKKKNLIATARAKEALGLLEEGRTLADEITDNARKMTDAQILELDPSNFEIKSTDTLEEVNAKKTLMKELQGVFEKNPKRLENITRQATGELRGKFDTMIIDNLHAEALRINADVDSIRAKQRAPLARITEIQQEIDGIQSQISGPGGLESQINPNTPTSDLNKQLQRQIDQLERQREIKEKEAKSLREKVDKFNERIETVTSKPGSRESSRGEAEEET